MKELIAFLITMCLLGWGLFGAAVIKIRKMTKTMEGQSTKIVALENDLRGLHSEVNAIRRDNSHLRRMFEVVQDAFRQNKKHIELTELFNPQDDEPPADA